VGVLGGILAAALRSNESIPEGAADQLLGPTHGEGLQSSVLSALSLSLQSGLGIIFWAIAGIALVAAAISVLFPYIPITSTGTSRGEVGQPAEMTVPPEA
jgi:hypothetical protein